MPVLGTLLSILIGVSLGFFGGGGSILTVPLLVYAFGLEPKEAIASSLLIVGVASTVGAFQHWRAGNVRMKEGLYFGAAGMLGAYIGGRASAFVDGGLLLLLFASMMITTAVAMWRKRRGPDDGATDVDRSEIKLVFQGFAVGSFTGLIGAGGGFLIVPALALWAGIPMSAAVGTSLLIIVLNCTAGFVGYQNHVRVDYLLVAVLSGTAVVGSFIGSRLASITNPAALRRSFAGFVMAMGCFVLVREGSLVAATVGPALPTTWPQVVFALTMLGFGSLAGRSSSRAEKRINELIYSEGGGI